jgi:hypothetical protein
VRARAIRRAPECLQPLEVEADDGDDRRGRVGDAEVAEDRCEVEVAIVSGGGGEPRGRRRRRRLRGARGGRAPRRRGRGGGCAERRPSSEPLAEAFPPIPR